MTAYYNEVDPYAADWLENLIREGLIAHGEVDRRSIVDVRPADLAGYDQCHFFAGIGGWSYALRLAGWPDDKPVWTGSCPCQPFSAAGKGGGFDDERHLWPSWFWLIEQCRPDVVFGEQVASPQGLAWLDLVQADCEGAGYAIRAEDRCAAGVGAPHIRQRLWWVANATGQRREMAILDDRSGAPEAGERQADVSGGDGTFDRMAHAELSAQSRQRPVGGEAVRDEDATRLAGGGLAHGLERDASGARLFQGQATIAGGRMADTHGRDTGTEGLQRGGEHGQRPEDGSVGRMGNADSGGPSAGCETAETMGHGNSALATGGLDRPGPVNGFWRDADWLFYRDGKWRPVEPGTQPLVDGAAFKLGSGSTVEGQSRVGMLRAYGNCIVPQVAAEFIKAAA